MDCGVYGYVYIAIDRDIVLDGQSRLPWLAAGAALCCYATFFQRDLGAAACVLVFSGVVAASAGDRVLNRCRSVASRWNGRIAQRAASTTPSIALRRAWRRFWLSFVAMSSLGSFSLWRVEMTVYRPITDRYYFFPADTWIGRIEHCWFNDALYAFGMVGILYVLYTVKEFLSSHAGQPRSYLGELADNGLTTEDWNDHQARSKLLIGTGITIILIWAWLEEIADLVPGYVFDKWDINAIFVGFMLGFSVMSRLSYPVFGASPTFLMESREYPVWLGDGVRLLFVVYVWTYTSMTQPEAIAERWAYVAELSVIVLGSIWMIAWARRVKCGYLTLELRDEVKFCRGQFAAANVSPVPRRTIQGRDR